MENSLGRSGGHEAKSFTEYRASHTVRLMIWLRRMVFTLVAFVLGCILVCGQASATVYEVGPGKACGELQEVARLLHAGMS